MTREPPRILRSRDHDMRNAVWVKWLRGVEVRPCYNGGMAIYGPYASVYDDAGQTAFSLRMIPYLAELLRRHRVSTGTMVDVACGTGTLAVAMAANGWKVYGVDASAEMLAVARTKADGAMIEVAWSQQDMRNLVLPTPMSLATCLYDSLNYMLDVNELGRALCAVAAVLRPDGLVICDLSTPVAFEQWANHTYYSTSTALDVIHSCTAGARRRLTVDIVGYTLEGSGLYRRFSEKHEQWAATDREMRGALRRAGLVVEGCYDCFSLRPRLSGSLRCAWVARKPNVMAHSL